MLGRRPVGELGAIAFAAIVAALGGLQHYKLPYKDNWPHPASLGPCSHLYLVYSQ